MEEVSAHQPVVEDVAWVRVEEAAEVGRLRRVATVLAEQLAFTERRAAEVALAVTEIGTNLHKHAREGRVVVRSVRAVDRAAVEVVAIDAGPGIADVEWAMADGRSTTGTLGVGLGTVARGADRFAIGSRRGEGTVLTARFDADRRLPLPAVPAEGLTRPIDGEEVCGDAYAIRREGDVLWLMMCDGSGHGPLAASASREATRVFDTQPLSTPEDAVARIHAALRGTRGGAVAVAALNPATASVRFSGLGNIAATVISEGRKKGMISVPGVAGYQARTVKAFDHPLPPGSAVVLHSDGLTERWTPPQDPPPVPLLLAAILLRDAGVRRDDAGVLVAIPT
ncbi:SpoIIE family protein phosphatase [Actinosynnema sp. NPDC020468]|uniref:SpoIIE family protein phosphatase n=1 Tax=Actinosynnema sp. NPDC020468 TaxID=3154488 RepID=UPI0033EB78CC